MQTPRRSPRLAAKRREGELSVSYRYSNTKKRKRLSYWELFPDEILVHILGFLHPKYDNPPLIVVCRRWASLALELRNRVGGIPTRPHPLDLIFRVTDGYRFMCHHIEGGNIDILQFYFGGGSLPRHVLSWLKSSDPPRFPSVATLEWYHDEIGGEVSHAHIRDIVARGRMDLARWWVERFRPRGRGTKFVLWLPIIFALQYRQFAIWEWAWGEYVAAPEKWSEPYLSAFWSHRTRKWALLFGNLRVLKAVLRELGDLSGGREYDFGADILRTLESNDIECLSYIHNMHVGAGLTLAPDCMAKIATKALRCGYLNSYRWVVATWRDKLDSPTHAEIGEMLQSRSADPGMFQTLGECWPGLIAKLWAEEQRLCAVEAPAALAVRCSKDRAELYDAFMDQAAKLSPPSRRIKSE